MDRSSAAQIITDAAMKLPSIYLASIDFLIPGLKIILKSLCCASFLILITVGPDFCALQDYSLAPVPSYLC